MERGVMDHIVKDASGKELGTIREIGLGKLAAFDRLGGELGTYDKVKDKTYDRLGLEIGNGNQLRWLIEQAWER